MFSFGADTVYQSILKVRVRVLARGGEMWSFIFYSLS